MRAFIAINFPREIREGVWAATAPLRESALPFRWVRPDGLHLTLKFLGDVAAAQEPEITSGLRSACRGAKPFLLPVSGFGAFPSVHRPRVVWVGCEGVPTLELLQHRLELEMEQLGFPLEGRPFRPHVTLGRARRDAHARALEGLDVALEKLEFDDQVSVRTVDLMESELRRDGAKYTVRCRAELVE